MGASRRRGIKEFGNYKCQKMNKRIRVDHETGEYFEIGKLAPHKYKKVMEETRNIQMKMRDTFGTGLPIEEEVLVLYEGERKSSVPENYRVVEMEQPRPMFFSANLLQKGQSVDSQLAETVRPTGLG